jgi:hypothetical protein
MSNVYASNFRVLGKSTLANEFSLLADKVRENVGVRERSHASKHIREIRNVSYCTFTVKERKDI